MEINGKVLDLADFHLEGVRSEAYTFIFLEGDWELEIAVLSHHQVHHGDVREKLRVVERICYEA